MSSHQCEYCLKTYGWSWNLKRHIRYAHGEKANPEMHQQYSQTSDGPSPWQTDFRFKHTFCMTLSGPTSCGKTTLVKQILQSNQQLIDLPPQRIVWLYRRWQPLYDVIQSTVTPKVEFYQGIPPDLDTDDFINPKIRNLIVLDDLMSTASKDRRITDLFTEGSHHRNLSIMVLNQNLYYSKDPTQRRNCHYLILFNNPIDKQQIMTLARQMYPENVQYFMRHFQEATGRPFGYLLVDLKPTTPQFKRLRANVFENQLPKASRDPNEDPQSVNNLKENTPRDPNGDPKSGNNLKENTPRDPHGEPGVVLETTPHEKSIRGPERCSPEELMRLLAWCEDCGLVYCTQRDLDRHKNNTCNQTANPLKEEEATMFQCDDCGAMFGSLFALRKHEQQKHLGDTSDSEDNTIPVPGRKRQLAHDDSEDETMPNKKKPRKEDSEFWSTYLPSLREEFAERLEKKEKEYMKQGHTERVSENMAINDYVKDIRKSYRQHFTDFLIRMLRLDQEPIFKRIMRTVRRLQKQGKLDQDTAVREAVRLHKKMIEEHGIKEREGSDLEDSNTDSEESEENE